MPKATRRKKLKAEDFRKTKLKVGKKVQPAQNQTDVSFKSQSIVVPNQSLGEVKPASELVNNRNQSLKDLIVQLRHYSSQSRKDALSGIRDIQIKYADTFKTQLSIIMEATAPILVDEDRQVRKSLLAFFKDFIPTVTRDNIRPFLSTILAYTCSAMTHISEDIRLDGLKFLTIWQDYYPTLVAMHAEKVIPNYLSMLSTNGKSQSIAGSGTGSSLLVNPQSQLGSAKARVEVLESLLGFLKLVMRKGTNAWWFFPGKEVQQGIAHATKSECISEWPGNRQTGVVAHGCSQLLRNHHRENLHNGGRFELFGASATSSIQSERVTIGSTGLGNKPAQAIRNTYQLADFYQLQAFIDVLMPTLVDLWLESSPNAFTPGSIAFTPALSVMHTVLKMMNLMWRSILVEFKAQQVKTNWVAGWLKVISKHFMTHFPFGKGNFSVRDKQVDVVLQDMNILFCELLSHFSLNATSTAAESSSRWKEIMLEYMMELFDENPSSKKQDKTVALLNSEQLEATFPIVWSLLNVLNDEDSGNFLRAFVNKGNTMWGTPSAIAMFQFMSRLLKFTNHQTSERSFTSSPQCIDVLRQWVLMLPKRLWQLKGSNPVFSKNILEVLTYLLKNNPCQFASEKAVTNGLESSIIPFFHVETAKGPVFGPFIASPEPVQLAAVTLLYYLLNWPEKLIRGFAECMTILRSGRTVDGDMLRSGNAGSPATSRGPTVAAGHILQHIAHCRGRRMDRS
ncbi:Rix1 complex component [Powellomyces hirtus]|nr:Rix1 complex component [Powellomyces hirtus]